MKFTILVDPSWVIITIHLICMDHARSREDNFVRNTSILHFLPQNYLLLCWGVMKFEISGLLFQQMLHTKFGKYWPSSLLEEDVNGRRRLPTLSNSHLSDSAELKSMI